MRQRLLDKLSLVLAAVPLAWLFVAYLFVLRARLRLGYWPRPSHPDPGDLGFTLHGAVVWLGMFLFPVVGLAVTGFAIYRQRVDADFPFRSVLSVLGLSLLVFFLVVFTDPGSFLTWFLD